MDNEHHEHIHPKSTETIMVFEKSFLKTALLTFMFLVVVEFLSYYGFFRNVPDFFSRYGFYIIFLIIGILINAMAVWHIKAYQHSYSHMSGMMIGMTIGMTSGFTIGLVVGATNGMFIGSLAGLIIGMMVGSYVGNCCGIMGAMEGMMAGLMGGIMGAMTSIMTLNDNLKIFIPILIISMAIILFGLIVMVYQEEIRKKADIEYKGFDFLPFITVNFIISISLTFLMVYGPRSFLFG